MKIDEIVNSCWAFEADKMVKAEANRAVYNKYKHLVKRYREHLSQEELDNFICIKSKMPTYTTAHYEVRTNIICSNDLKALMCDGGNLCFGYSSSGINFNIHTD